MQKRLAIVTLLLLTFAAFASAQDKKPLSPAATAQCKFADGKSITVNYSSPRAKRRKIYGGLAAYRPVWRPGANEATTFVTNTNLNVGGKDVPAGSYTIFAVPSPDKWTLVVSKKTGEWGVPYPGEGDDFTRTDMTASKTSAPVENFTIAFDQSGSKCTMRMEWENTRASVEVSEKK